MKQPKLKEIIAKLEKEDYAKWEPLDKEAYRTVGIFLECMGGYALETADLKFYISFHRQSPASLPFSFTRSLEKEIKILEKSSTYALKVRDKSGSAGFDYVDNSLKEFYTKVYNYVKGPRLAEEREKKLAEKQELAKKELENAQKQKDFEKTVSDFLSQ